MGTPWRSAPGGLLLSALLLDPLDVFRPTVAPDDADRRRLDGGAAIAQSVAAPARHVGVFAAVRVDADGDRLARWLHDIAAFKESAAVPQIGRFSDPPRIDDLAALTIDREDVATLRRCTPAQCSMLFTAEELSRIEEALDPAVASPEQALLTAVREILLARATAYVAHGRTTGPPPAFLAERRPELTAALQAYPAKRVAAADTFLYWEKDRLRGKPVITVTHVTVIREAEADGFDLLAIGRHVFSTRYIADAWSVTALVPPHGPRPYFAYIYQARVDRLGGVFGRLIRRAVERQLETEARTALVHLRERLESGDPPTNVVTGKAVP